MIGSGKYDALCTEVRVKAKASAALLIIFGGEHGAGFSAQIADPTVLITLPEILEDVAKQIRKDLERGKS